MFSRKNILISLGAALTVFALEPCLAQTTSPFNPPEEDFGKYVINSGSGLDTGCSFRSQGPLLIRLSIPSPVNKKELNGDGTLASPQHLINEGIISDKATIRFPVYDIDDDAQVQGFSPEIDRVSFNGAFIKTLDGANNTWTDDSFEVDITQVKFASENNPGIVNELRIDIDTANSIEAWCMAVDWVAIEYKATYPYVLAHGIAADSDTWNDSDAPGVLAALDERGVLYTKFSVTPNGAVIANAQQLKNFIKGFLAPLKAKKVNIIAHSKGGLDSQALAKISKPDFEVLSLSTLSTPHLGSVVADLTLIQRNFVDKFVNQQNDPNGFAQRFVTSRLAGNIAWGASNFGLAPGLPGLADLTPASANAAIRAGIRGNVANTFTVGADAGPNCGRDPTPGEISPMASLSPFLIEPSLRLAYRSICSYSTAVELGTQLALIPQLTPPFFRLGTVLIYKTFQANAPRPNDIVVGTFSANPGYGTSLGVNQSKNHSTVKNGGNVRQFLNRTIPLR